VLCIHEATSYGDTLVADLVVEPLDTPSEYCAVSYTWGRPIYDHWIICNGERFAVTENLHKALLRFRATNRGRFWEDQICINQECISERNHQVTLMKDIFQHAKYVYVWLGQHKNNTKEGLEFAVRLPRLEEVLFDLSHSSWESWVELFDSPWFRRVWIIQEVLAYKDPTGFYGDFEFTWAILAFSALATTADLVNFQELKNIHQWSESSEQGL
jgi:hypothetical protein